MKRPLSHVVYVVGPFIVRRDAAGERLWRVFPRLGVVRELYAAKTLGEAFTWATRARVDLEKLQDGGY